MAMSWWSGKEMPSLLRIAYLPAFALLLPWCLTIHAQNSPVSPAQENPPPQGTSNTGVYTGREIFVPKPAEESEPEPARSFADGFLRNARQHFGFSFSAFESYSSNALGSSTGSRGMTFTSLLPQVHANFQNKGLSFRLNYGAAYNRYNESLSELNRVSQTGTAAFVYSRSRRKTTFQVMDYLNSMYNDPGSFIGSTAGALYRLDSASQIYIERRRVTQNTATIGLNYALTRKSSVSISGNHDTVRYSGDDLQRTNQFSVSASAGYQITRWMNFNVRYTHELNRADEESRNNNIQSLQFAGFAFKLGRGWEISSSGGIETTKNAGIRLMTASGQAGISKTARRTLVGVSYHRGYSAVFPASDVWYGDAANLNLVQRLASRVNVRATGSYFRGSVVAGYSSASTVSGSAALEIILQNNLVTSANYYLVSQTLATAAPAGTSLRRHSVSAGLQYFLPSVSRR
jgi:hypothetical protein